MRRLPVPFVLTLALAATAALTADAPLRPETLRATMGLKLGEWQTVSKVVYLQAESESGDKAEAERATAEFRAQVGESVTEKQCLWDNRNGLVLPGLRVSSVGCEYSRLEARDGKFAVTSLCKDPKSDGTIAMALEGTYTPERMTVRSEATASANGGTLRIKLETESRFTGKCEGPPVILTPPTKGE